MVRRAYHDLDINCAKTTLKVLSDLFECPLDPQVFLSATAMHGAGRSGGQCGLVEGALMFMGIYFGEKGVSDDNVSGIAKRLAGEFKASFGSISCSDLRPGGFQKDDPPHKCEGLTVKSIVLCHSFIKKAGRENLRNLHG